MRHGRSDAGGSEPEKKSGKRGGTPPAPVKRRREPVRRLRQAERLDRILKLPELLQERSPHDANALSAAHRVIRLQTPRRGESRRHRTRDSNSSARHGFHAPDM